MEPEKVYYNKDNYLETQTGNKISRKTLIKGFEQIQLLGKCIIQERTIIRADLAKVNMGKYTIIKENATIKPSYKKIQRKVKFIPIEIGEFVMIENSSIIMASKIGSNVHIGKNCIVSHRCIISDNVKILDDSIVPPDTYIPPYSVYGGKPAVYLGQLPETTSYIHTDNLI
ncbi:Trimeric LpxA-like protein [Pseudocohnilembus persalinus]|uniref:Dynactin subunit 5 n=1 Tax=Pseudocohnilembus persalinus TaxID=266149 RepID=A0A0V0QSL7_PSEPJ|nr:Trimeric LpxA-like protein [Pseudocohnilembus persalinus]|eukprot:KRX05195.1 Trimeric LpxA-like protein [Pseudocohnilembus persalinus]